MRFTFLPPLLLCLVACHHGIQNNDAVRQGVLDHLSKAGLNTAAMDITLTSVQFNGNTAVAAVDMTVKGGPAGAPMSFKYRLEQQNNKWVVTGRDTGASDAHGGAVPETSGANPHGGALPPSAAGADSAPGGAASMPAPEDLPPAAKK